MERQRPAGVRRRLTWTVALLGCAAWVLGYGAYATFTATASTSSSVATGTVTLAGIGTNAAGNRLSIGASNIVPGDTIARAVTVTNTGSVTLASITLTTSATTSSLLDTDATNGLQLQIDRCSVAWTESGAGPPYTYTCGGTTSSVLASRAVIGSSLALSNLTLTASATNYLVVTMTFPTAAPNSFQGLTSVISFTFTGTQRSGTSQ